MIVGLLEEFDDGSRGEGLETAILQQVARKLHEHEARIVEMQG